jgi:hypothetical protein
LKPGQFIFGRKAAARELKTTERKIRTCVHKLENLQNLTIKTTNKFSIISIMNWEIYQGNGIESDQQSDQQVTSKRPASDHKQERKKGNKELYTPNFLKFWEAYPKKEAKGKAFEAYKKIKEPKPSLKTILDTIEQQKKLDGWQDKQYIPQPATWLNQRRWEDEIDTPLNGKSQKSKEEILKQAGFSS